MNRTVYYVNAGLTDINTIMTFGVPDLFPIFRKFS